MPAQVGFYGRIRRSELPELINRNQHWKVDTSSGAHIKIAFSASNKRIISQQHPAGWPTPCCLGAGRGARSITSRFGMGRMIWATRRAGSTTPARWLRLAQAGGADTPVWPPWTGSLVRYAFCSLPPTTTFTLIRHRRLPTPPPLHASWCHSLDRDWRWIAWFL